MKTRRGICYDLTKSDYRLTIDGNTFVFSSQLHKDKFQEKYREHRDILNYSLSKRFKMAVDVSPLADFVLYGKIEKRGFLILNDEGITLCRRQARYVGGKLMK